MKISKKNYLIKSMEKLLNGTQLKRFIEVVHNIDNICMDNTDTDYLTSFLKAKQVEGRSDNTIIRIKIQRIHVQQKIVCFLKSINKKIQFNNKLNDYLVA